MHKSQVSLEHFEKELNTVTRIIFTILFRYLLSKKIIALGRNAINLDIPKSYLGVSSPGALACNVTDQIHLFLYEIEFWKVLHVRAGSFAETRCVFPF